MTFDLNALIRTVARDDTSGDMRQIVKEVRARIAPDEIEDALDQCLATHVYDVARGRNGVPSPSPERNEAKAERATPAQPGRVGRPAGSRKVQAIRETWRARLDDRVCVATGVSKPLGQCTAEDLEHAATLRFHIAEANRGAGRAYKVLAALVAEHGAREVGQLPETVLADYFGGRRAA